MLNFWKTAPDEAEVESIASRQLFEAAAALVLKQSSTQRTALLEASRLLRGHCDEQIRKADKAKKTTRHSWLLRQWRTLTGLASLESELELERNRSIQTVRLVAESLKTVATSAALEKKDFYAACLIKARDMQDAAAGQARKADSAFFNAVGISLAQMAQRFAPEKTTPEPETTAGEANAIDHQK